MCLFQDPSSKQDVAIKFDPVVGNPNVLTECLFLREFSGKISSVPEYKCHSTIGGRRYLVMKYLEQSVEEHI